MEVFDLEKLIRYQPEKMAKVDVVSSERLICGLNCFEPGQVQKVHAHTGADKLYFVVEGSGDFIVGKETRRLGKGQILYVPQNVEHGVNNTGPDRLTVLIVITPNPHA